MAFVALSRFVIANGREADVKEAFRGRPHMVEDAAGFESLEVMSPLDRPAEIWLITRWSDEASFRTWHKSHLYRASHSHMPKGLKLIPAETELRFFEQVST